MNPGIDARFAGHLGRFSLDVTFTAPGQGVTALFGPSGCGKTTVLRCVAGLNRLAGHLEVAGATWQDERTFLPTHRRPIGYVFQEASLFPHLSVRDNLDYGRCRARGGEVIGFDDAVDLLGLVRLLERAPTHLSGGERQRVALGRALLTQPQLLLMDEPLAALDRLSKEEILPYLEQLNATLGLPVLYVSHDLGEVERLADHLILLQEGRVEATGPLTQLLADPRLPLARAPEAASVLEGIVAEVESGYGLLRMRLAGGEVLVPGQRPVGERVRLRVAASEVSLGRRPPADTSILNALPCRIIAHEPDPPYQVTVFLALGEDGEGERLLARISRKSWDALALQVGERVYARVKAINVAS